MTATTTTATRRPFYDLTWVKEAIHNMLGYEADFNHLPDYNPAKRITYVYLAQGSILKIQGRLPGPCSFVRGCVQWAERRPQRQITICDYKILSKEESVS